MDEERKRRKKWSVAIYAQKVPVIFESKLKSKMKSKWQFSTCAKPAHDGEYELTLYIDEESEAWDSSPFKLKVC